MLTYRDILNKLNTFTEQQLDYEPMLKLDNDGIGWIYELKTEEETRKEMISEGITPLEDPNYTPDFPWFYFYD